MTSFLTIIERISFLTFEVQTSDRQVARLSNMGRHARLRHNDVQLVRDGTVERRGKHLLR